MGQRNESEMGCGSDCRLSHLATVMMRAGGPPPAALLTELDPQLFVAGPIPSHEAQKDGRTTILYASRPRVLSSITSQR
jgi:hypothetical protein